MCPSIARPLLQPKPLDRVLKPPPHSDPLANLPLKLIPPVCVPALQSASNAFDPQRWTNSATSGIDQPPRFHSNAPPTATTSRSPHHGPYRNAPSTDLHKHASHRASSFQLRRPHSKHPTASRHALRDYRARCDACLCKSV